MLKKLEKTGLITLKEARRIYSDKWFEFSFVKNSGDLNPEMSLGHVIYLADTEEEIQSIPAEESRRNNSMPNHGYNAKKSLEIGGSCLC